MAGAILSDTKNLQSGNTTYTDRVALQQLCQLAGLQDVDAFYRRMYEASLSYEGMTDEEIFFSDYKEYESGGTTYSIGVVNACDEHRAADLAQRMQAVFPSALASTGMDMAFTLINVSGEDVSFSYIIPSDDAAAQVLDAAFQGTAVREEGWYRLEPCASRKKDVVPPITKVLEAQARAAAPALP